MKVGPYKPVCPKHGIKSQERRSDGALLCRECYIEMRRAGAMFNAAKCRAAKKGLPFQLRRLTL